ncbi:MAG TPA: amidohydrolase [Verrucomicrobiales bacterium]|nr:amidohydrolase [Verrucomicrobiales bacterium]
MRIDSHQHFWRYSEERYPWIKPDWPIRRDFPPTDLEPLLKSARLDGCVAVQARQSVEESRDLLKLSDEHSFIRGVVGWVDLCGGETEQQIEELSQHPRFVGVRHVVQDEPDDDFMLREDFRRGIGRLKPFGLTYDILIYPRQLPAAIKLVEEFPDQPFVLDHIAKPHIRDGKLDPWRGHIDALAQLPNCWCKVSGMVTEARWREWKPDDFRPYLDAVFGAFGVDRLMFGSDWPVCLLAADYPEAYALAERYVSELSEADQGKFFGGNAAKFYCLT